MCLPPEWPWELPKHNACPRQRRPLATLSTRTGGGSAPLGRQGCTWVTLNASQGPGQDGVALEAPPPRGLRCACLVMCPRALGGCHALGTGHLCLLRQLGALAPKPAAGPARAGRDGSGPGYSLVPLVAIHVAVPSHQGGRTRARRSAGSPEGSFSGEPVAFRGLLLPPIGVGTTGLHLHLPGGLTVNPRAHFQLCSSAWFTEVRGLRMPRNPGQRVCGLLMLNQAWALQGALGPTTLETHQPTPGPPNLSAWL